MDVWIVQEEEEERETLMRMVMCRYNVHGKDGVLKDGATC
jgi:hypothetical protein